MKEIKIGYRIKMNEGKYTGKEIFIEVCLDEFDCDSVVNILIQRGYLKCWCNDNEFEVIKRYVL